MNGTERILEEQEKMLVEQLESLRASKNSIIEIVQPIPVIEKAKTEMIKCYLDMQSEMKQYLDMPENYYKIIAIWIIGTYFHEQFNTYPYLFFNAMRGSGKTRAEGFISFMGREGDGKILNNITEAVLFRLPKHRVVCIDEIEQIGTKEKQTLRELLNAAYKKGMRVTRMKKNKEGNFVPEHFEPFFPICLANIWGLDEVLQDRSISLILEKSNNPLVTKKVEDFDSKPELKDLKTKLTRTSCSLCSVVTCENMIREWNNYINNKYTTTLTTLTTPNYITTQQIERDEFFSKIDASEIAGRNFELWLPLLLTAKVLDNSVFEEILEIAKTMVTTKTKDEYTESKDVILYDFISHQIQYQFNEVAIKELTRKFREYLGEDSGEDNWLNDKWMGKALKRLQLILTKKRLNTGVFVTVNPDKAKEKLKIFKKEDTNANQI